jgi:uncharacterized protein (DUF2461 family)
MTDNPPIFSGFTPAAIQFLADLAENNDRAWFQPRKPEYERLLKEPLEAMIAALADRLAARGVPIAADPKKAPFRMSPELPDKLAEGYAAAAPVLRFLASLP